MVLWPTLCESAFVLRPAAVIECRGTGDSIVSGATLTIPQRKSLTRAKCLFMHYTVNGAGAVSTINERLVQSDS